ncbi:MAG: hypothetical protein QMD86_01065 [Patescibacteria group bacterium]|nr:hypothetical protein [Patescibacteria group bacterium]
MSFENQNKSQTEEEKTDLQTNWSSSNENNIIIRSDKSGAANKFGSYMKRMFLIVTVVFFIAGGFGVYYLIQYNKTKDLRFIVKAPDKVMIGKPFDIVIDLENKSKSDLKKPKILIKFPDGALSISKTSDKQFIEENLGDLGQGAVLEKKYQAIILKDESSIKQFGVNFSYLPPNLNTRFEKNKIIEITADQPAIVFNLSTPQKVFNHETFEMSFNCRNLSDIKYDSIRVQLDYPSGFIFKEASSSPNTGKNIWIFNDFLPDTQKNVAIKGWLEGPDQSFYDLKSRIFASIGGKDYLISEKNSTLNISSSPLSLGIIVNGNPNYIATANDSVNYEIAYKNNTDVGLSDAVVTAKMSGEMFDFSSLQTQGAFDSKTNTILWNAATTPELKLLAQGQTGKVAFSIKTKPNFPIKRMFDKNYLLKVQAEINSPTVPYNVSSDKTAGLAKIETKISGNAVLTETIEHISGPNPPLPNQSSVYAVRWTLKNYSTDIKDAQISSVSQPGIKWLNIVKSNVDTIPLYNDRTGEIIWTIGKIVATKGVVGKPTEATFEIEITPNINQRNQVIQILSESRVSATDEFTGIQLSGKNEELKIFQ